MQTFRLTWERLCDCLHTSPRRIVTWYDGPNHRLRISYYPKTGEMKLYLSRPLVEHGWLHIETYVWPDMSPEDRAHRARAALIAEAEKRLSKSTLKPMGREVHCRHDGRLRTVAHIVVLALMLAWCGGCEEQSPPAAAATPVEIVPQPGAERCEKEGHEFFPCVVRSGAQWVSDAGKGPWWVAQVICLRCLKRVDVR